MGKKKSKVSHEEEKEEQNQENLNKSSSYKKSLYEGSGFRVYLHDTEAPPAGVDNMTKLAYLHEPGVLHNLACRLALNEIYSLYTDLYWKHTDSSKSLTETAHLYDIHMMEQYKGAAFGELSPHLFAVADTCYRAIIHEQGRQSILVSGESGA
ncbi:hypothetical protein Ddye_028502, partial [Dipteronia dyeriana]